jgi:hypothetical protein
MVLHVIISIASDSVVSPQFFVHLLQGNALARIDRHLHRVDGRHQYLDDLGARLVYEAQAQMGLAKA